MSDDALPLDAVYASRQRALDDQEWQRVLRGQATVGVDVFSTLGQEPVDVDVSSTGTEQSAAGAAAMPSGKAILTPPIESPSEAVRDRAQTLLSEPLVRRAVEATVSALTGMGTAELQRAIQGGELPEHVGGAVLKALDVAGTTLEAVARQTAQQSGLDAETTEKVATATGLLAGMMLPPGMGARKAATKGFREAGAAGKGMQAAKDIAGAGAHVNLERVAAAPDVKTVIANISAAQAERLASHRKTVSHAQTIAESAGALSLDDALRLNEETALLDRAQMTALRDHYNAASTHVTDLAKRTVQGDPAAGDELLTAFAIAGELAAKDEAIARNVARGLESRKVLSQAERAPLPLDRLNDLAATLKGADIEPAVLAQRLLSLERKHQQKTMLLQTVNALKAGQGALYEAWINGLLSGPQTHAANVVSNAITALWAPGERFLSAALDPSALAGDRSVFFGESIQMLYGLVEGAKDGIRLAGRTLRKGTSQFGPDKLDRPQAITAEAFGWNPNTLHGAAVDFLGTVVRMPSRMLMTEDAFFKAVNYRAELRALAYREARQEGLSGEALARRVRELVANPPPAVKARADQFALTQTFNQELSELGWVGGVGRGAMAVADNVPAGRIVLPFVRTPTNITHYVTERVPGLNALSDTLRADILAGGERRALAMGKVGSGMLAAGIVASLAASGLITGGGPKDPNLRRELEATGWRPYSIKIGNTYYSYARLDPLGATLGIMADYSEIAGQIPKDERAEFAVAMGLAVSKHMLNKTYLQGLASVLEAMEDPSRGSEKWVAGFARSLVPAGVRHVARAGIPGVIEGDATRRDTYALDGMQRLLNEIKAGIPGYSSTLPPRRNLFGEPVQLPAGWGPDLISPIYSSTSKDEPVSQEIVANKVSLSLPGTVLGGTSPPELRMQAERPTEGVRLTAEEYDRLIMLTAKPPGEPPLKDALKALIGSDQYREASEGPDGGRAFLIRQVVSVYKHNAQLLLRQESPILDDILKERVERRVQELTRPARTAPSQGLSPTLGR